MAEPLTPPVDEEFRVYQPALGTRAVRAMGYFAVGVGLVLLGQSGLRQGWLPNGGAAELAVLLLAAGLVFGSTLTLLAGCLNWLLRVPTRFRVGPSGLAWRLLGREWRSVAWADIEGIEETRHGGRIRAAGRRVPVSDCLGGWRRLLRQVARHLEPKAAEPQRLDPEGLAALLGIRSGGAQTCRLRSTQPLWVWAALVCLFGPAHFMYRPFAWDIVVVTVLEFTWLAVMMAYGCGRRLSVEAGGLRVRSPYDEQTLAWSDVHGLEERAREWVLQTGLGDFCLPRNAAGRRVARAIKRVLDAARGGLALPDAAPPSARAVSSAEPPGPPALALSRMTSAEGEPAAARSSLPVAPPPEIQAY